MAPAQRSIVWMFFKKSSDNKFVICNLCKQQLKYFASTSNLRQHIIRKHNIQYKEELQREKPDAEETEYTDNEEEILAPTERSNITIWSQNESLALINIFALYKDKFKRFKNKKSQWNFISEELAKIGIHKIPEKCEIKWKNLLRVYRHHKYENKPPEKFEFFKELDDVISNDPQLRYSTANLNNPIKQFCEEKLDEDFTDTAKELSNGKKRMCFCLKNEKQKRHEDRMALMTKKLEIEERKVRAFEDYLKFLRGDEHV